VVEFPKPQRVRDESLIVSYAQAGTEEWDMTEATCTTHGHIYGWDKRCVFCQTPRPVCICQVEPPWLHPPWGAIIRDSDCPVHGGDAWDATMDRCKP
jgi:hypothetical protein